MSRRPLLSAGAITAAALALAPAGALAANKSVTIAATPNPDVTGDPVTIFGKVNAPNPGNQKVVLWHKISGQHRFTPVFQTQTDATGFYSIARAEGVVRTNRRWFVRAAGKRSRVVNERVYAEVALNNPPATVLTRHRLELTGKVTPGDVHRGERILLQVQRGQNGDRWHTIDRGRIRQGGTFVIGHKFGVAGSRTLRVKLRRDKYNLASASSPVSVSVEQAQNPRFTIGASKNPIFVSDPVTLSGQVAGPHNAGRTVGLFGREANGGYHLVASTTTDGNGRYSFTQTPPHNTLYQARIGRRHSVKLAVGVHDNVSIHPSGTTSTVGGTVTFTGSVAPPHAGHIVFLQRLGDDSAFHTIAVTRLGVGSQYQFSHTFSSTGTKVYRVLVPGGPKNLRGVSSTATVTVS